MSNPNDKRVCTCGPGFFCTFDCEDCDAFQVPKPKPQRFDVIEDKRSREYRIFDNERKFKVARYSMFYFSIEDVQTDCYKLNMKETPMTNRYKVRGKKSCYGVYDLQEKKFVSPLFPAWDNPHEPHTNAMSDGYKKAQALCDKLNRKEQKND